MSFTALIAQLEKRQASAKEDVRAIFERATSAQGRLKRDLELAERRGSERESVRDAYIIKQVDPARIRRVCGQGQAAQLSRTEKAAVLAQFAGYGADVVSSVLAAFPALRPKYLKRLLRAWGVPVRDDHWDALVHAGGFRDDEVGIRGLPLAGSRLLKFDAPGKVVAGLQNAEAEGLLAQLIAAGLRPDGPFVSSCLLAWFQKARADGKVLGRSMSWALATPHVRSQLAPRFRDSKEKVATNPRHPAAFAALVLGAHREKLISDSEFEPFVSLLTSPQCDFGDPRMDDIHPAWGFIKAAELKGYEALVERLNKEDLQFFFDKSMQDARDRRDFWLNYLKEIRRTQCVLDGDTWREINRGKDRLPERLQQAFHRAGQFKGHERISAFCLWFDKYVVIEFSRKGNATYVYTLEAFEKHVRPQLPRPWTVKDLKHESATDTWNHNEKWESRFRMRLGALGIWAR